jgi:hypothetical protein
MQLTCQCRNNTFFLNKSLLNQVDGNFPVAEVMAAWLALPGSKYVFHVQAARRMNGFINQFNEMEKFRGVLFFYIRYIKEKPRGPGLL